MPQWVYELRNETRGAAVRSTAIANQQPRRTADIVPSTLGASNLQSGAENDRLSIHVQPLGAHLAADDKDRDRRIWAEPRRVRGLSTLSHSLFSIFLPASTLF